jgi:hypothetical protein
MKRAVVAVVAIAIAIAVLAGTASGGGIRVDASLSGCKPSGGGAVCNIRAAFTGVAGAEYYTASVTRPDGATQGFGRVPAGGASVWPRYTGDGTYTITITAWDDGQRVKRGSAGAGG